MNKPNGDKVAILASRLARASARRAEAEEEIKAIKAEIAEEVALEPGLKLTTADGVPVACVRRTGRRFDPIKAGGLLPDAVIQQISTMQIDAKVAKVKLPKATYNECLTEGNLSIVVK